MKKIISILLVVLLCVGALPLTASAAGKSINFDTLPEDYALEVNAGETVTITDTVKLADVYVKRGGTLILDGAHLIVENDQISFFTNGGIVKATEKGGSITVGDFFENINIVIGVDIVSEHLYNMGTMYRCNCKCGTLANENVIGECNLSGVTLNNEAAVIKDSTIDFEKYKVISNGTQQFKIDPSYTQYPAGEVVPIQWTPYEEYADKISFISWEIINLIDNTLVEVSDINSANASFVMPAAPVEINAKCSFAFGDELYILGSLIDENNLSGDGWSYNPDTKVLTFDNFIYNGNSKPGEFDFGYVVLSKIDKLTVTGDAKISLTNLEDDRYRNYAFAADGDIVFDNADIEIITDCGVGIDGYGNIEIINKSNIKVNAGTECADEAIYTSQDIIINDSTVKAVSIGKDSDYISGGDDAIDAGRDIILNNANVEAISSDDGLDAYRNVIINDSKVIAKSLNDDSDGGTSGDESIEARRIEINGNSTVNCYADDNGLYAPEIFINSGKVVLESPAVDTVYPAIDGILYYNGGSVEIKSQYFATSYPIQVGESVNASILTSEKYDGSDANFSYDDTLFINYKYVWLNSIDGNVDTVKAGTKLSKVSIDGTLSGIEGSFKWIEPNEKVNETGYFTAIFIPDDESISPIRVSVKVVVCSHICHNESIIARTFWSVMKPVFRLFGIQKNCECGASHF